jgi:hypothetical protein
MKNLTEKQKLALKRVEYFIPSWVKWTEEVILNPYFPSRLYRGKQSKEGVSAEEAFFMITEKGKSPELCCDVPKLESLLWGQHWMAANIKMWCDDFHKDYHFARALLDDFKNEPDYIGDLFLKSVKKEHHYRE